MKSVTSIYNCGYTKYSEFKESCQDIAKYLPAYEIGVRIFREFGRHYAFYASSCLIDRKNAFLWSTGFYLLQSFLDTEFSGAVNYAKIKKMEEMQVNDPNKKIALICIANSDLFGAITRISPKGLEIFKKIAKDYTIVFTRVGSIQEINKSIAQINSSGKKISLLYIAAHGAPESMRLGSNKKDGEITSDNIEKLTLSKLEKKAKIVLLSCSVGGHRSSGLNIAELFQKNAGPLRKVYAPTCAIVADHINYSPLEKTFSFTNYGYISTSCPFPYFKNIVQYYLPPTDITAKISLEKLGL